MFEELSDFVRVTLRGDDVQGFDTQWDEVLSSVGETPKDDTLESMYRKLRDSEQLKTTFALYNRDTLQKNEPTSYTRLKNMVKRYLDEVKKDRNFDERNDRTANAATMRRKSEDRSRSKDRKSQCCRQWLAKWKCSKGWSCSFRHDTSKNGKR